jgi:hypothetical protein
MKERGLTSILHDLANDPVEATLRLTLWIFETTVELNESRAVHVADVGGDARVCCVGPGRIGTARLAGENDERHVGSAGPEGFKECRERVERIDV